MERPFPAYEGSEPYIFVSYDHDDAEIVFPEMSWIRDSGFNLWYDDGIHVGTVWRQALADALGGCSAFIFFSTVQSNQSDNCLQEINFALDEKKAIYVVQLDDTALPPMLRLSLSDRQALKKTEFDEDIYRSRLRSALGNVIEASPVGSISTEPVDKSRIRRNPQTLLILPIAATAGDAELEQLAEALTEDLTAYASKRRPTLVGRQNDLELEPSEAGRLHDARYLLYGNARKRGPDLRVTMKLVSAADGRVLWSQWYDRPFDEFYQYQDVLVAGILGALFDPIMLAEKERNKDRPIEELDARALLTLAWGEEVVDRASRDYERELVERAVAMDPDLGIAHARLAQLLSQHIMRAFSRNPPQDALLAVEHADRALALAPNELPVLLMTSNVHRIHGNETLGIKLAEQATDLNGSPVGPHYSALIQAGRSEEVFELAARDHSPPQGLLALADLIADRLEEAAEKYELRAKQNPRNPYVWASLANALALTNRMDEARDAVDHVRSMLPTWTVDLYEKGARLEWRQNEGPVNAMVAGLRKLEID